MTTAFASLGIPEGLAGLLEELGFVTPFDVQTATIPDALAGRDIGARAPTGSGKTLAFGLPLLIRVEGAKPRRPRGLVLAPTRELADQIRRELDPIARAGGRSIIAIYGGVGYEPQKRALARGVDVLVACPGRLADLIEQGDVDLGEVEVVVIDEADRMSDMGFLPEVKRLLNRIPDDRQTLLYSATLDGDVGVLVREYQRDPVRYEIGDPEPNIKDARHLFWRLESNGRVEVASNLIQAAGRTIVFCRTRRGADRVAKQLERAGATAAAIHGSRSQNQRNRALKSFADGKVEALVATDVAARGIHIDGVACVLHFDPPVDDKTYLHRSGRTARAGAQGLVVSFVANDQLRDASSLVRNFSSAPTSTPRPLPRCRAPWSDSTPAATPASPMPASRSRMPGRPRGARVPAPARPPRRVPASVAATIARAPAAPSPARAPLATAACPPRTPTARERSAIAPAAARARTAAARVPMAAATSALKAARRATARRAAPARAPASRVAPRTAAPQRRPAAARRPATDSPAARIEPPVRPLRKDGVIPADRLIRRCEEGIGATDARTEAPARLLCGGLRWWRYAAALDERHRIGLRNAPHPTLRSIRRGAGPTTP